MKTYDQHPSLLQALDFDIKLTEDIFGVFFEGETFEEKVAFANKYEKKRKEAVDVILKGMYDEYSVKKVGKK